MNRQFDVVANPDGSEAALRPFLVILQSDLVSGLKSAVVAPLVVRDKMDGANRLNPIVQVDGREFWLATHEMFAIDRRMLAKTHATIEGQRSTIMAALDFIFIGY